MNEVLDLQGQIHGYLSHVTIWAGAVVKKIKIIKYDDAGLTVVVVALNKS